MNAVVWTSALFDQNTLFDQKLVSVIDRPRDHLVALQHDVFLLRHVHVSNFWELSIASAMFTQGSLSSQVAHNARFHTGFLIMKTLGVFLLPLDGMLFHCRVTPVLNIRCYPLIHLGKEKFDEHNEVPWSGVGSIVVSGKLPTLPSHNLT